jgi:Undecaprenyl-phosphate glucose phosphotransferase
MNDTTGATAGLSVTRRPGVGLRLSYASLGSVMLACDILMITCTSILSLAIYSFATTTTPDFSSMIGASMVISALFSGLIHAKGLYRPSAILKKDAAIAEVLFVWVVVFLFAVMAAFLLKVSDQLSRGAMGLSFLLGAIELVARRRLMATLYRSSLMSGRVRGRRVLVLSENQTAHQDFAEDLVRHGYEVVAAIPALLSNYESVIAQACRAVRTSRVDEILVISELSDPARSHQLLASFRALPIHVRMVPDRNLSGLLANTISDIGPTIAIDIQRSPLTTAEQILKRSIDIVAAGAGLILLAPFMAAVGIIIKLESPGPTIFRQTRVGFNGQTFRIYKFRSMTTQDDGPVVRQATRGDRRVTRVGRILRQTSIDELPQLVNVLKGDMSLVGPRPHALAHDTYYESIIADYAVRHRVKPGITGWAQVCGHRGETLTPDAMAARVQHDLWYASNWSLMLDIRIMLRTIFALAGQNTY